jgi:hypothetical protein
MEAVIPVVLATALPVLAILWCGLAAAGRADDQADALLAFLRRSGAVPPFSVIEGKDWESP